MVKDRLINKLFVFILVVLYFLFSSFSDNYGNIVEIVPQSSKTTVSVGESFYLTININFKSPSNTTWYVEDEFKLLKIEEFLSYFNVISRSVDRKIFQANDYDVMDLTYTYVLQARQEGEFTLKDIGLSYVVNDNNLKYNKFAPMDSSRALTIRVVLSGYNPPLPGPHSQVRNRVLS
ncbi:MAG: BatD family protein, partial [bacterium]